MYDNHISDKTFRHLKFRVSQLYYGVHDEDPNDILLTIEEEYSAGSLSSTQYDNLIGEMMELGYTL